MKSNLWKKSDPGSIKAALRKSLSVRAPFVVVLVVTLSIGCSNSPSKSTPQKPTPSPSTAGESNAQPTKVTSRASSSKKDRDKEDGDDSSDDSPRPAKEPKNPKDTGSDPKKTPPKNPPLDPALARMTCDAPPIRGDAIKLIAYLNNPNPPGGERLTPEERRRALDSVKGIDVTDPASVKIVQDQLDDACKK